MDLVAQIRGGLITNVRYYPGDAARATDEELCAMISHLDCSGRDLTSLPLLPNILWLICASNPLMMLPFMPRLQYLDCSFTDVAVLPEFPILITLICVGCPVIHLPCYPLLEVLDCRESCLMELPALHRVVVSTSAVTRRSPSSQYSPRWILLWIMLGIFLLQQMIY